MVFFNQNNIIIYEKNNLNQIGSLIFGKYIIILYIPYITCLYNRAPVCVQQANSNVSEYYHRADHAFYIKYFVQTKRDILQSKATCLFDSCTGYLEQRFSNKFHTHFSWLFIILKDLTKMVKNNQCYCFTSVHLKSPYNNV